MIRCRTPPGGSASYTSAGITRQTTRPRGTRRLRSCRPLCLAPLRPRRTLPESTRPGSSTAEPAGGARPQPGSRCSWTARTTSARSAARSPMRSTRSISSDGTSTARSACVPEAPTTACRSRWANSSTRSWRVAIRCTAMCSGGTTRCFTHSSASGGRPHASGFIRASTSRWTRAIRWARRITRR